MNKYNAASQFRARHFVSEPVEFMIAGAGELLPRKRCAGTQGRGGCSLVLEALEHDRQPQAVVVVPGSFAASLSRERAFIKMSAASDN